MRLARHRPHITEYSPASAPYVDTVPSGDILAWMRTGGQLFDHTLSGLTDDVAGYRYDVGKWSIREVVSHVIDGERILSYRALRVARGDTTPLPGYDGDAYISPACADERPIEDLRGELRAVRESTTRMFESLPLEAWIRVGVVDNFRVSVRALAYILVGHALHHCNLLTERYGLDARAASSIGARHPDGQP